MGRSAGGAAQGLPRAQTTFVGRADETAEVAGLLGEFRLVTVTGPGGVGKTRLAVEVARQVAPRFADGVWMVELAAVQDAELVPAVVAVAVGVQQEPGVPVMRSLVAALARQQALVVLDNCEHLLDAVADLCATLLAVADDARLLATSRVPMGVAAEARYRLRPLPVSAAPGSPESDVPGALTLFADRARQADPHFCLDEDNRELAAQLVARLDGIPLAIELAAARVEALGLRQLIDRLGKSFDLLTGGDRTAPPRQRSLAATVEWSYRLLDEPGRQVFRRLAIFPGPFTLDAAAAIAGAAAEPVVLHLVDCSLLTPPRAGKDGRPRYLMLEILRAFGYERLAGSGELQESLAALASYARAVAERAAKGIAASGGERDAARWLDAEDSTVHRALAWALQNDPATALQLATALAPWWYIRCRGAEGYAQLSVATADAERYSDGWCAAQYWLGQMAITTGDFATGLAHFTAATDDLAALAPSPLLADVLAGKADTLINLSRIPEGIEQAKRALNVARELGYPAAEVLACQCFTVAAFYSDDFDEAVRWAREASRVNPAGIPDELRRACVNLLTMALTEAMDFDAARETCLTALDLARKAADLKAEAFSMSLMAGLDLRGGRLAGAWSNLAAALHLAVRIRDRFRLTSCLSIGGQLCAAAGQWAEAVTVWTAETAFLCASGMTDRARTVRSREESLRKASQALGSERIRTAKERGAAMTVETAADYLLLLAEAGPVAGVAEDSPAVLDGLSDRERELVTCVAQGSTDAQIAAQLYISVSTVRSHLDRIRDKTSCRRRADLTRLALQSGLV